MARPILSVLVVTYCSRDEIADCLRSIPRSIGDRSVQVIVIDNASNDETSTLVREMFPWVECIDSGANLGFGKANNVAYKRARGEYVVFLNPDTISNTAAYEHCLGRLQNEPNIGAISPKLVMPDGTMDLACRRSIPTVWDGFCRASGLAGAFPKCRLVAGYNLTYLPDDGTYDVGAINGAFTMCPHVVLERVGLFDETFFMYGEDLDLCYRLTQSGYRVVYDGRTSIIHIKGASSSKSLEKMSKAVFTSTKQFYLKHFNPKQSRWVKFKYDILFGAWEKFAKAKRWLAGHRRARPL